MPVVTFGRADICSVIGHDVPMDELTERMPMIGGDLDKVNGEDITIEWFPDRPDLLTLEGTGRAMRAFLGHGIGLQEYPVAPAKDKMTVDASVAAVRPYAALCFVRGVAIDEAYVQTIIDAQEKFTLAPGRKRRKIAIGVHDAAGIEGPFTYTCIGPDDKPFVPLAWDAPLTPRAIMAEHPKGQEYGHLLPDDVFPVFLDGNGDVLSLPPVINAAKTTVTATTRDLLLDVTGTDAFTVKATIALLATSFAERGGTIEAVDVTDTSGTWSCPDLRPTEHTIHTDDVERLLGIQLTGDETAAALQRMGHGAEAFDNKVLIHVPAWRFDILHPVDLLEDVAIGHGFENFPGHLPSVVTFGGALPHQATEERLRSMLNGLGWSEARTLSLSNDSDQWGKWGAPTASAVTVRNPVLEEQTILRQRIVPSLLGVLAANRHRPLPQRIFELGYVVTNRGGWHNRLQLGVVESGARGSFSDVKGLAEAIVRDMALNAQLVPAERQGFIPGRQGSIVAGDTIIGHFGELHPDTIVAFGLGAATIALELDVAELMAHANE